MNRFSERPNRTAGGEQIAPEVADIGRRFRRRRSQRPMFQLVDALSKLLEHGKIGVDDGVDEGVSEIVWARGSDAADLARDSVADAGETIAWSTILKGQQK